jgi:Protein of unknown function (DUF2848)
LSVNRLRMQVALTEGSKQRNIYIDVQNLIIAGWTGRDAAAIQRHIEELEAIGVARPKCTPMFYRVSADRLTTQKVVDVIGCDSTGEVEFVLLQRGRELFVGLGSDQTDRKVETVGVTLSKQMCPKPVAAEIWRWSDVGPHWDELSLRCTASTGGKEVIYQEGTVTAMLHPKELLARYAIESLETFAPGTAMFCGTLAAKNKIAWAESYALELVDPVLKRRLNHAYCVRPLLVVD